MARLGLAFHGLHPYREGIRTAARENATAYGYSIMVTSSFGVLAAMEPNPPLWAYFLFAFGAALGFPLVILPATKGWRELSFDAERTSVLLFAAVINVTSVLIGVGAAALVAWPTSGWAAWLTAPIAASALYLLVNGVEYAVAEEEEDRERREYR